MPLLVIAGVIPLIVVSIFYASSRAAQKIRTEALENLTLKTDLLAESVARWEESNILTLLSVRELPGIAAMDRQRQKPILSSISRNYKHIYLAHTVNKNGEILARSDDKQPGGYRGDRTWFKSPMSGTKLTHQVLISRTINKPALCVSSPIRQNRLSIVGVMAICTDLEALAEQVGRLRFGQTGYAFVVNQSGLVLAHPNNQYISGTKLSNLSKYPPVSNFLSGNEGFWSYKDNRGIDWISDSFRLNNGWGIIVVQQKDDFLQSEREFENLAFLIAIVAVFGVSLITWIVANHLIAPISNLTDAATAIADGKLNRQVKIKREDELGILGDSFNRMTSQLKNAFKNLHARNIQLKNAKEIAEKAQETAELANQSKDRFLANISHELRTPLNGILGYTKLVMTDDRLDSSHSEYLKVVETSGIHLLNLINDILDISKNQLNKIELDPDELQLSNFLDETIDLIAISAKEKNLELTREWDELPNLVLIDEKRFRQILLNLLSNAVKFTELGKVTLRVTILEPINNINSSPQQKLRFEVIDTGIGITQTQSNRIFQPFEQLGDSKSRANGTGLGLSIASELVKLMGGKLQVQSKLGVGSTFWFDIVLPVVQKSNKLNKPQAHIFKNEIIINQSVKPKILVVDDNKVNRELLIAILKPKGFDVFTANNGQQMLEMTALIQPNLILLDLFMPVKTGFTSAKELREDPKFNNIPLIVVTASFITKEMSTYLDCDAVLHKPIDEKELLMVVDRYLSNPIQTSLQDLAG